MILLNIWLIVLKTPCVRCSRIILPSLVRLYWEFLLWFNLCFLRVELFVRIIGIRRCAEYLLDTLLRRWFQLRDLFVLLLWQLNFLRINWVILLLLWMFFEILRWYLVLLRLLILLRLLNCLVVWWKIDILRKMLNWFEMSTMLLISWWFMQRTTSLRFEGIIWFRRWRGVQSSYAVFTLN